MSLRFFVHSGTDLLIFSLSLTPPPPPPPHTHTHTQTLSLVLFILLFYFLTYKLFTLSFRFLLDASLLTLSSSSALFLSLLKSLMEFIVSRLTDCSGSSVLMSFLIRVFVVGSESFEWPRKYKVRLSDAVGKEAKKKVRPRPSHVAVKLLELMFFRCAVRSVWRIYPKTRLSFLTLPVVSLRYTPAFFTTRFFNATTQDFVLLSSRCTCRVNKNLYHQT